MGNVESFCDVEYSETKIEIAKKNAVVVEGAEEEMKKMKERAVVLVGCGGGGGSGRQPHQIPDDLAFELLTRLSLKDLQQFKLVSKSWCSMIRGRVFSEAYRSHHPNGGLLISILEHEEDNYNDNDGGSLSAAASAPPPQLRFYYSNLEEEEIHKPNQFFCRFLVPPGYCYEGVTQVVNGLACFYDRNRVFVVSVCTGEIMRLPDSEFREDVVQYNYYFGFDPVDKVYKLLKWSLICRPGCIHVAAGPTSQRRGGASSTHIKKFILPSWNSPDYYKECELLTLGRDSSWRRLDADALAPLMLETQSFWVDGFLYWLYGASGLDSDCVLVAFDLNKDKFRVIFRPPRKIPVSNLSLKSHRFVQFMGHLALFLVTGYNGYLTLDTLKYEYQLEDDYQVEDDMLEYGKGYSWTRHAIKWPSELGSCCGMVPVGNLPTGQILFANPRRSTEEKDPCIPIYSFDPQNNTFRRFVVGQFPPSLDLKDKMALTISVSCLVEKVDPLNVLFGDGEHER